MTRKPKAKTPSHAVSDEAAAYIADALMELALQFESSHFAQIRRHYQSITPMSLTVDHRAAPSIRPLTLDLATNPHGIALRTVDRSAPPIEPPSSVDDRIIAILAASQDPLPFAELRAQCRARSATVYERLAALTATGRVSKSAQGYRLVDGAGLNGHGPDKA
jgi:hypothetical protein